AFGDVLAKGIMPCAPGVSGAWASAPDDTSANAKPRYSASRRVLIPSAPRLLTTAEPVFPRRCRHSVRELSELAAAAAAAAYLAAPTAHSAAADGARRDRLP